MLRLLILLSLTTSLVFGKEPNEISMSTSVGNYTIFNQKENDRNNAKINQAQNNIQTKNPYLGYCYVDYLYWAAKKTGVFLNEKVVSTDYGTTQYPREQKAVWESGVRGELGFSNIFDWMIDGSFTYYKNQFHRLFKASPYTAYNLIKGGAWFVDSSEIQSKLVYWTSDLDIATFFNFSRSVTFKPIISARVGFFDYKLDYSDIQSLRFGSGFIHKSLFAKFPIKFLGFGPKVGLNAYFKFDTTGLDFFGGICASLLYGKIKFSNDKQETGNTNTPIAIIRGAFHDLKASLALLLGTEWKYFFDEDSKALMIRANWETNYWWDLANYFGAQTSVGYSWNSALILYGINIGIGLEF